jgi:hypothetical protein
VPLVSKVKKRREPLGSGEHHMTSVPSITAVRTAARHEHLPPEAAAPIAAATGFHGNGDFVDEHGVHLVRSAALNRKLDSAATAEKRHTMAGSSERRLRGNSGERKRGG